MLASYRAGLPAVQWKHAFSVGIQKVSICTGRKDMSDDMPIKMENPYKQPPDRCTLCGVPVDYKNVQLLSQFVSSMTGLQYPRKATSLCEKKYKEVTDNINKSRSSGFMPYALKEAVFLDDPVLTRSHQFSPVSAELSPEELHNKDNDLNNVHSSEDTGEPIVRE